ESLTQAFQPLVRGLELGGDGRLAPDEILTAREDLLAHRNQLAGRAIGVADRLDDDDPAQHDHGDAASRADQRAFATGQIADHRAGLGAAGGADDGRRGWMAGGTWDDVPGTLPGAPTAPGGPSHQ